MLHAAHLLPQRGVMLRHRLPSCAGGRQPVRREQHLVTIDAQLIVERDTDGDRVPAPGLRHAVSATPDFDVTVPRHVTDVEVARVVVRRWQRLQVGQLLCEPLHRRLPERAKLTRIGHLCKPLFQLLIEMSEAVEAAI